MKLFQQMPKFRLTGTALLNLTGALIVLYLTIVLGQTIKRNYDLGRQIESIRAQNALLKEQNDTLSYSIQYYKTNSYQDREARSELGLQLPGENVVIIPGHSSTPAPATPPAAAKPAPKSNFQQWLDFLSGATS